MTTLYDDPTIPTPPPLPDIGALDWGEQLNACVAWMYGQMSVAAGLALAAQQSADNALATAIERSLPAGGTDEQMLCKVGNSDFDTEWEDPSEMGGGSEGPPGPTGPAGPVGAPGSPGPQGAMGPAGSTGAQGGSGPQGDQGPLGPEGPQGEIGPQGETGPAGMSLGMAEYTFNNTATAPPASGQVRVDQPVTPATATKVWLSQMDVTGIDQTVLLAMIKAGDELIITDKDSPARVTYTVTATPVADLLTVEPLPAEPTASGVGYMEIPVQFLSSLGNGAPKEQRVIVYLSGVGKQGPAGPQGSQGLTGSQGPEGQQGTLGPLGAPGPSGPQGAQGIAGPKGGTGDKGDPGVQGATGSQGAQGVAGSQGVKGDPGPQGPQGTVGPQGPQGQAGTAGATGAQGVKGDTGAQGATGATGPTGPPGGAELAYAELTTSVSATVVAAASAVLVVSAPAVTFDGTAVEVSVYVPAVSTGASATSVVNLSLWDGATDLGIIGQVKNNTNTAMTVPVLCRRKVTPAAGSHTFSIKTFAVGQTGSVAGGVGGSGVLLPGFCRIVKS